MDVFNKFITEDDANACRDELKKTELQDIINLIQNEFLLIKMLVNNAFECALMIMYHLQNSLNAQTKPQILRALRRRNTSSVGPSDVLGKKYDADPNSPLINKCLHTLLFDFLIYENYTISGRDGYCTLLAYCLQNNNLDTASFILKTCTPELKITIQDLLDLHNMKSINCNPEFIKKWIDNLLEEYSQQNTKLFEHNLILLTQYLNNHATQEKQTLLFFENEDRTTDCLEEQILHNWVERINTFFMTKILLGDVFSNYIAEALTSNYFHIIETLQEKPQPGLRVQKELIPLILQYTTPATAANMGRTCTMLRKIVCGEQSQEYWKECLEFYWPGSSRHGPRVWWLRFLYLYHKDPTPLGQIYPDSVTCELAHEFDNDMYEIRLCHSQEQSVKIFMTIHQNSFELRISSSNKAYIDNSVTSGSWQKGSGSARHALLFFPTQTYRDVVSRNRNTTPVALTQQVYRGWILQKKSSKDFYLELHGWQPQPVVFSFTFPSSSIDIGKLLNAVEYSPVTGKEGSLKLRKKDKCVVS